MIGTVVWVVGVAEVAGRNLGAAAAEVSWWEGHDPGFRGVHRWEA